MNIAEIFDSKTNENAANNLFEKLARISIFQILTLLTIIVAKKTFLFLINDIFNSPTWLKTLLPFCFERKENSHKKSTCDREETEISDLSHILTQ